MARQHKGFRAVRISLVVYMLLATVFPLTVFASGSGGGVPQVSVPTVTMPEVNVPHAEVHIPQPQAPLVQNRGVPASQAALIQINKTGTLGAKDVFKRVIRTTLGGREVIYKAVVGMDDTGRLKQGGWKTARAYAAKTISPWVDVVGFDALHVYLDAEGLVSQGRTVKKSYDAYKLIKDSSSAPAALATAGGVAGTGRIMGASFPILGGSVGIITGTMDIVDSFSHQKQQNQTADTAKFYSGVGSIVGGIGSLSGGIAMIAAGTAIAPALALAGTVLLAAGMLFGAAAVGLKYSASFRNSQLGRRLTGFKNWLGDRL